MGAVVGRFPRLARATHADAHTPRAVGAVERATLSFLEAALAGRAASLAGPDLSRPEHLPATQ